MEYTRIEAKIIRMITTESKADYQVMSVCAGHIKRYIDKLIEGCHKHGKTGNWCTQEEWNERLKDLESTAFILEKLEKIEAI